MDKDRQGYCDAVVAKQREYDAIAAFYDVLYPGEEDATFYIDLAREVGAPILELGTGTGRVAVALAVGGHDVVGVDVSIEMLKRAERRALLAPRSVRPHFIRASMTDFVCPQPVRMVIAPFSALLELQTPEARVSTFRCCYANLHDDGVFAFDNWFRGVGDTAGWGKPRPRQTVQLVGVHEDPDCSDSKIWHFESQDYGPDGAMALTVFLDVVSADGAVRRMSFQVHRGYVGPMQTIEELKSAGFSRVELFGGFRREPFLDPALAERGRQVFLARK
jgi:SAM-dependent methyltransferase